MLWILMNLLGIRQITEFHTWTVTFNTYIVRDLAFSFCILFPFPHKSVNYVHEGWAEYDFFIFLDRDWD